MPENVKLIVAKLANIPDIAYMNVGNRREQERKLLLHVGVRPDVA